VPDRIAQLPEPFERGIFDDGFVKRHSSCGQCLNEFVWLRPPCYDGQISEQIKILVAPDIHRVVEQRHELQTLWANSHVVQIIPRRENVLGHILRGSPTSSAEDTNK